MYRSWMKNQDIPAHEFQGRPIIGICNTWSELTPCNAHFRRACALPAHGLIMDALDKGDHDEIH
jgi:L-arabonate dehydrase